MVSAAKATPAASSSPRTVREALEAARSRSVPAWRVALWRASEASSASVENDNGKSREVRHG